jgi:excisionase family DNA binding protein
MADSLAPLDANRRYAVDAACGYLSISRSRFYEKVAAGEVRVVKDGKRTFVPGTEIARLCRAPDA